MFELENELKKNYTERELAEWDHKIVKGRLVVRNRNNKDTTFVFDKSGYCDIKSAGALRVMPSELAEMSKTLQKVSDYIVANPSVLDKDTKPVYIKNKDVVTGGYYRRYNNTGILILGKAKIDDGYSLYNRAGCPYMAIIIPDFRMLTGFEMQGSTLRLKLESVEGNPPYISIDSYTNQPNKLVELLQKAPNKPTEIIAEIPDGYTNVYEEWGVKVSYYEEAVTLSNDTQDNDYELE